ncbi:MAG: hypothetical protein H6Q60_1152 [Oscillospiraceae bacterium]|nr:hypothetical protein [Oscillospiraceae bacterium]
MKDRIPTYPGRVTLTPVTGQANTYDIMMADEPTEAGTPPTKENLLSDTTSAAIFNSSSDHTVSEALNVLAARSMPKIGDIKTSSRTGLGSNWLLCNGATFSPSTYASLAALQKPSILDVNIVKTVNTSYYWASVQYVNGYYIACGYDSTNHYAYIAYALKPGDTWTTVQISSTAYVRPNSITYGNGYYVAAGSTTSSGYPAIMYSTTLTSTSWTAVQLTTSSTDAFAGIAYGNGYFVATNGGRYYAYATTPSGTWSVGTYASGVSGGCIAYLNGYFVVAGTTAVSSGITLRYATTPSSWTSVSTGITTGSSDSLITSSIAYQNGRYIIAGYYTTSSSLILYSTSLGSGWASFAISGISARGTYYINGYYAVYGHNSSSYPTAAYSTALSSWTIATLVSGAYAILSVAMDTEGRICGITPGGYAVYSDYALPTISPTRSYAYIKALDGD